MAVRRRAQLVIALCVASCVVALVQSDLRGDEEPRLRAIRATLVGRPDANFNDPLPTLRAAQALAADARTDLYRDFRRGGSSFIYPPFAAVLAQPLAHADDPLTLLLRFDQLAFWLIVAIACVLVRRAGPLAIGATVLGALAFHPLVRAVELNQSSTLVTLALAGALLAIDHRRFIAAGVALALAVSIKPHLVLMLPLLTWHARKTAVVTVIACAALLVVSVAAAGLANHVEYATHVLPALSDGYAFYPNQSWNGVLNRFASSDMIHFALAEPNAAVRIGSIVLGLATLALGIGVVARARREPVNPTFVLGFAWLVATLASPIAWEHHYAPALLLFALWLRERVREPALQRFDLAVAGAWILIANYFEVRGLSGAGRLLASYGLVGALLLAGLYARLIAQRAT